MMAGWVICLSCGHRYYLEKYTKKTSDCCPLCSSREHEPDYDTQLDEDIHLDEEY